MQTKQESFSYSKLSTFDQCPHAFKLKYEDQNFSGATSLAMEIGTIAHKCKELVALCLIQGQKPDYLSIGDVLMQGFTPHQQDPNSKDHGAAHLPGVQELKEKYAFNWYEPDNKSGLTYDQKVDIFLRNLPAMEQDPLWRPLAVEVPFSFQFEGRLLSGFIDKVDISPNGALRVVDYKTSKALFDEKKVKTAMQMVIYSLAVQNLYRQFPAEHLYDFVFLGKTQLACSKGYLDRGKAKLRAWFTKIDACRASGSYPPRPSPLCHWCNFCATNTDADPRHKTLCSYYCRWTPINKTFEVAQRYTPGQTASQNFWF